MGTSIMSMCMTAHQPTHSKFLTKVEASPICVTLQCRQLEDPWLFSSPLIILSLDKASTQAGTAAAQTTIAKTTRIGLVSTVTVRATPFTASITHIAKLMARLDHVQPPAVFAINCVWLITTVDRQQRITSFLGISRAHGTVSHTIKKSLY